MTSRIWILSAVLLLPIALRAQRPVLLPEVHADHTVTFRFKDPKAETVYVNVEGQPRLTMVKDSSGMWSATTPALEPEYYGYSFNADGVELADPSNARLMKPNLVGLSNMVHVPGPMSLPWEENDVPHGEVHHHFYRSQVSGDQSDFYVYTPPGYDPAGSVRYPVLYLLHGFSDDASGWTAVGRANVIMDNLIAEGKAVPMVVVMPLCYGISDFVFLHRAASLDGENYARFGKALLGEVIPRIEAEYRVRTDRESRAIAGVSMGGAESFFVGLRNLERFAWICPMSSGKQVEPFDKVFSGLNASANAQIRLLWISCGKDDGFLPSNQELSAWLTQKGIHHTDVETPGAHTWLVWRRNLATFAPLLFRS